MLRLQHRMTKDAYSGVVRPGLDEMTLVAGDSDYVPVVNDVSAGFMVHVAFWGHAAKELREAAARFVPLDDHFDFLSRVAKT